MFLELALAWVTIGLFFYIFAMFGMDRIYGEYQQDLLTLEKKVQNPKNCPLCKQNLTTWFSQCVSCTSCDLRTCRSCADYNQTVGEWTCHNCVHQRNNREAGWDGVSRTVSKFWYDEILLSSRGSLGRCCLAANTHLDKTTATKYDQIETVVSQHLSLKPDELNATDVGKVYADAKYDLLFSRYHEVISLAVDDILRTSSEKVQDSVALKKLKELMNKVKVAAKLDLSPEMEPNPKRKTGGGHGIRSYEPTYPDILSTAILNRIIIDSQTKSMMSSVSPVSNDSAVVIDYSSGSTDLPESGSEKDTHNWVMSSTTETSVLRLSDDDSIVDIPVPETSLGSTWSESPAVQGQGSLKIEESIEEITTQYGSTSDHGSTSSGSEEEETIQEKVATWEQNWLFARRKDLLKKRQKLLQEPVSMLVPNPTSEADVMIGTDKASDLDDDLESLDINQLGYVVVQSKDTGSTSSSDMSEQIEPKEPPVETVSVSNVVTVVKSTVPMATPRAIIVEPEAVPISKPQPKPEPISGSKRDPIHQPKAEAKLEPSPRAKPVEPAKVSEKLQMSEPSTLPEPSYNESLLITIPEKIPTTPVVPVRKESSSSSDSETDLIPTEPLLPMRIAEREKEKWNHPVAIKNNPYAAENLSKRLKSKEYYGLASTSSREDLTEEVQKTEIFPTELRRSLDKFRRDYYVSQGSNNSSQDRKTSTSSSSDGDFTKVKPDSVTPSPPTTAVPSTTKLTVVTTTTTVTAAKSDSGSDLDDIKLPSVKNLAKRFSSPVSELSSPVKDIPPKTAIWRPVLAGSNAVAKQQNQLSKGDSSEDENDRKLEQVVAKQPGSDASTESFRSFVEDALTSSCNSMRSLTSSSSSDSDDLSPDTPPPRELKSPSLYQQFSTSQSAPLMSTDEMPAKSTLQMVLELERRAEEAQTSTQILPGSLKRSLSGASRQARPGAMEELAQQPLDIVPRSSLVDDPDLKKLKRSIVRGARMSKGLSADKERELLIQQDALDPKDSRVQDCEFTV